MQTEQTIAKAKAIGLQLKELRQATGMTQTQLADKAKLTQKRIVEAEKGIVDYKISTFLAILEAMGVKMEIKQ